MNTGDIFINEFIVKDAGAGLSTSVLFSGNTNLVIRRKAEFGRRSSVNFTAAHIVKINVEQENVRINQSSDINASIDVRFKDLIVEDATESDHAILRGSYIAKKLDSKKWVDWFGSGGCVTAPLPRSSNSNPTYQRILIPYKHSFSITVYPNPSPTEFQIRLNGSGEEPVTIRIMDISGNTISLVNASAKTATISTGSTLKAGIYFAEVRQGNSRKVVKMIKMQ
jgi:hypothetical protein